MANVRLFGETSGFVELAAPNAAGNNTVTLPTTGTELVASDGTGSTTLAGTVTASGLTVDGTATFAVGSSGTPAIAASGDTNTGIYFPAADTIGFAEGGNEAGRFDSSGRFLVGTSTARTGLGPDINPLQQVEGTSYTTSALSVINNQNTANQSFLILGKSRGTSVGANTVVQNNDTVGEIRFVAADGTDLQSRPGSISCAIDGTPGADDTPGRLVFSTTADGASSPTERMRLANNGRLRVNLADFGSDVGTSNKGFEVEQNGIILTSQPSTATQSHHLFYNPNGNVGNIQTNGSSTSFNTSSDYRLKENVVPVADGITRLQQLNPARFNFIADPNKTVDGFLAHEVQDVVPEAISGEKDAVDDEGNPIYQGIDQSKLVPLLTAALQEAIGKIEALETANASLEARLTALESA